jgi:hypothetical protein
MSRAPAEGRQPEVSATVVIIHLEEQVDDPDEERTEQSLSEGMNVQG